jgi:hypothetical protein
LVAPRNDERKLHRLSPPGSQSRQHPPPSIADELGAARMAGDIERRTRGLGALLSQPSRNAETAAERFDRLDADGDGRIAEQEFCRRAASVAARRH